MSLTEIMSSAKLSVYPILGLVFFMIAFSIVLWRVFRKNSRDTMNAASRIPLDDATPAPQSARSGTNH